MSDENEAGKGKVLTLSRPGRLELKKTVDAGQVRQSFSHGRSKAVTVEVRKKRTFTQTADGSMTEVKRGAAAAAEEAARGEQTTAERVAAVEAATKALGLRALTEEERAARARALQDAKQQQTEAEIIAALQHAEEEERRLIEEERRAAEEARLAAEAERLRVEAEQERVRRDQEEKERREKEGLPPEAPSERDERRTADAAAAAAAAPAPRPAPPPAPPAAAAPAAPAAAAATAAKETPAAAALAKGRLKLVEPAEEEEAARRRPGAPPVRRPAVKRGAEPRRRGGKITVTKAFDEEERVRSLASVRRARERERRLQREQQETTKVFREVVVPETITVQELANRMAERAADVIKALMRMGVMATLTQSIDADTAELLVAEFGHRIKRVSEADVEIGLRGEADLEEDLEPRPPVVTIMGHVDHGKTSLLDALRATDVAAHEAGGITQHIGAYRVRLKGGQSITFIDTPGHEAFTAMRARGANVTDIVVLVVAADDGVMPQTVEAINHAKAAGVPMLVAINKIDRPDANPTRVRNELLQHGIVDESLGGDTLSVEVSAIKRTNLDKLEEMILLQAEILDLRANPHRDAEGVVIEARLDRGRGNVATVLVQRGSLHVADIVVAGAEWGRVRALVDDTGELIDHAGPSVPVELLGLNGSPQAGDDFTVVETEGRAREITDFRRRRAREARVVASTRGTLEQMFSQIATGAAKEFAVVVKADVQGSAEAIQASLERLATEEVKVRVLHAGVGGINESDIGLAKASNALVIGFNVRANPQARDAAAAEHVDIRYYSIIYDVVEDAKRMMSGMLSPESRETHIGAAQVLQVFEITKIGKVAGCRVTDGVVRRGSKVRILRDSVVVHEGQLSSLRRFKDEVREVREGMECGLAVENYSDVKEGDVIECFEVEQVARTL